MAKESETDSLLEICRDGDRTLRSVVKACKKEVELNLLKTLRGGGGGGKIQCEISEIPT